MQEHRFLAFARSSNTKTGDIAQTYTSRNSCPTSCPFHKNGCYGENYGTNFQWNRADKGMTLPEFSQWVLDNTDEGQLIRHNIAGDMAEIGTSKLDKGLLLALQLIFLGRKVWTFTHCDVNEEVAEDILRCADTDFVINISCETFAEVDYARSLGLNAVLTVPEFYPHGTCTPGGHRLIPCPEQERGDINCKKCKLCATKNRSTVICFKAHGTQSKKIKSAIEQKINLHGITL